MEMYRIRAHHGLCTAFFKGKGYSDEFTDHMAAVIEKLNANPVILPVEKADEICRCCPNLENGVCISAEKVGLYDKEVLKMCGMSGEEPVKWLDFQKKVMEKIILAGRRREICGDCQWSSICDNTDIL
ncbi:DUF1284 domain-containing protein [Clostridium sp. AM58-1XD]|uniref:DUF1284 domain-containing protein n=1 Tax=Clostridium sp. AM58-1XD TaxID=2292307 RepID=UPI001FA8F8C1|nr:DUF1284 domain-containing protein [Clostridium sp. AM58-1XD]